MGWDKKGGMSRKCEGLDEVRDTNGSNAKAGSKAKACPHPRLRAWVGDPRMASGGRIEYVNSNLTVLDNLAPQSTGRWLPDPQPAPYEQGEQLKDRIAG